MIRRRPFLRVLSSPAAMAFISWRSDKFDSSEACRSDIAIGRGFNKSLRCSCMSPRSHTPGWGRIGGINDLVGGDRRQLEPSNEVVVRLLQFDDAILSP